MKTFNLTDPGEGLTEAEIIRWHVAEGDEVKVNDIVVEVETSKSIVELPIPWAGRVDAVLVAEGATVDIGTPIIRIDDGSGADEPAPERTPNLVGYGPTEGGTRRRARRGQAEVDPSTATTHEQVDDAFSTEHPVSRRPEDQGPLPASPQPEPGAPLPSPGEPERWDQPSQVPPARVLAKPPLRKYAKDHGVDLTEVAGTGPNGVIRRPDVDAYIEARDAAPAQPVVTGGLTERRVPIKGVRKATAAAMVSSAFTAPHATEWVTVDVTATMELLERLKTRREFADTRLSPLLLTVKAVCLAIRRTPELNTSWDEAAQEVVYHGAVNLGIAVATPRGLLVPNIKSADRLEVRGLATALDELVSTAREGHTQPTDLSGGTFTITNVGVFGIDAGTPILNPGEAGIVALGAFSRRPWVVGAGEDERIEPRWVTTLAVSFDHRLVDGEQGSIFLADVARILADPAEALLF